MAVAVENLSASESRIRDADIAQVSSELVSRQIVQQAGVAVLALLQQ
jgi:flagellin